MEESQLRGRLVAACAARLAVSQQGHRVKLRMMKDVVYLEDTMRDMMDDMIWGIWWWWWWWWYDADDDDDDDDDGDGDGDDDDDDDDDDAI